MDLIAVIAGVCANGLSSVVPTENHEDVLVLLYELLPSLFARVALG